MSGAKDEDEKIASVLKDVTIPTPNPEKDSFSGLEEKKLQKSNLPDLVHERYKAEEVEERLRIEASKYRELWIQDQSKLSELEALRKTIEDKSLINYIGNTVGLSGTILIGLAGLVMTEDSSKIILGIVGTVLVFLGPGVTILFDYRNKRYFKK